MDRGAELDLRAGKSPGRELEGYRAAAGLDGERTPILEVRPEVRSEVRPEVRSKIQSKMEQNGVGVGSHWAWHLLLGAAAVLVVLALWLDPASAATELERAQARIAQAGLVVLALGAVCVWLLRRWLEADRLVVAARWRSAPSEIPPASMIPSLGPAWLSLVLWTVLAAWATGLAVTFVLRARWVEEWTLENGPFETATVLCYLAATGFAITGARARFRSAHGGAQRWVLVALAAGCFLIAAEETDWGQTYLRYATPPTVGQANIQGDFSLHNLALPASVPGTRWANWLLRILAWTGGLVLPLLLFASATLRRALHALQFPMPPAWCLVVLFLAACIPELGGLYGRSNIGSELREFSISVAVVVWLGSVWHARAWAGGAGSSWQPRSSS
jgi:hypothetical protein